MEQVLRFLIFRELAKLESKRENIDSESDMIFQSILRKRVSLLLHPVYQLGQVSLWKSYMSCVLVEILIVTDHNFNVLLADVLFLDRLLDHFAPSLLVTSPIW